MFARELPAQDRIANRLKAESAEDCPQFLAIASWFALHDCTSCQKPMDEIVIPADCIDDTDYSDTKHLFGFRADAQGINALTTLRGLTETEVFIHDGRGGYVAADDAFLEQLGLGAQGMIDVSDPEKLRAAVESILQDPDVLRYISRGPTPFPT
jgi:hypothetical protein